MSAYQAPIEDMRFVMDEIADMAEVSALPGFEDLSPDLIDAILEEAGKTTSEILAPINHSGDVAGCSFENGVVRTPAGFKDAYHQFIEMGWNGMPFDPEFGGQGLPWLVTTAVTEMVQAANMSFGLCPLLTQGAVEMLTAHATDELKSIFLGKLVSGEWNGTMNLTEPQAGSDLSRIRSKAEKRWRFLSHQRNEAVYHLWRTRLHRQHHPSGARPYPGRPRRNSRYFAFCRTKISG